MYNENMSKLNCFGGPASCYFPGRNKTNKNQYDLALNRESYAFQKTFLKTFKLYKKQTLVKCKLLTTKDKRI